MSLSFQLCRPRVVVAVLSVVVGLVMKTGSSAAENDISSTSGSQTSNPKSAVATVPVESAAKPATAAAAGIREVLKLAKSGASQDLLLTFVESSPGIHATTAEDVIALREGAVPDEVIKLMLRRGVLIRESSDPSNQPVAMPAVVSAMATEGRLDPESYEFWYYHYAYPRALAISSQRLNGHEYLPRFGPNYTRYPGAAFHRGRSFHDGRVSGFGPGFHSGRHFER